MFQPLAPRSLSEAIYEELRDRIVGGSFSVGEALPSERTLSSVLNVNRNAVREALKRLEQARLVTIRQGGHTTVLDFVRTAGLELVSQLILGPGGAPDPRAIRSVMEMRTCLGADIARLAAQRRSPEALEAIRTRWSALQAAEEDLPRLQEASMGFWEAMVEASDNVAYRLAFNTLQRSWESLKELLREPLEAELRDLNGHAKLVRALERGQAAAAEREARRLLQAGERGMMEALERLTTRPPPESQT